MATGFSAGHFYHPKISRVFYQGDMRSFFVQGIGVTQVTRTASKGRCRMRTIGIRHLFMAKQTSFPGKPIRTLYHVFLEYQNSHQNEQGEDNENSLQWDSAPFLGDTLLPTAITDPVALTFNPRNPFPSILESTCLRFLFSICLTN